jgi:hypothetical protein
LNVAWIDSDGECANRRVLRTSGHPGPGLAAKQDSRNADDRRMSEQHMVQKWISDLLLNAIIGALL